MRKANQDTVKTQIVDGKEVVNIAREGGMPVYVPVNEETENTPDPQPE